MADARAGWLCQELCELGVVTDEKDIEVLLCTGSLSALGRRYGVGVTAAKGMRQDALGAMIRAIKRLPSKEHTAVALDWVEEHLGPVVKTQLGLGSQTEVFGQGRLERLGELPRWVTKMFSNMNIQSIDDLLQYNELEIRCAWNFGPKSWAILKARLDERGLRLAQRAPRCFCPSGASGIGTGLLPMTPSGLVFEYAHPRCPVHQ